MIKILLQSDIVLNNEVLCSFEIVMWYSVRIKFCFLYVKIKNNLSNKMMHIIKYYKILYFSNNSNKLIHNSTFFNSISNWYLNLLFWGKIHFFASVQIYSILSYIYIYTSFTHGSASHLYLRSFNSDHVYVNA